MTTDGCNVGEATIDILPDDTLLTIFFLYKEDYSADLSWWEPCVHVCRRWRHVILASPLGLGLTIVCTSRTPVKKSLNIWPPLPIAIRSAHRQSPGRNENIIAALEQPDRITDIRLHDLTTSQLRTVSNMMACPFPALTYLSLDSINDDAGLPNMFLSGSAPSLQTLRLTGITFLALPKLLSSTTQLVTLEFNFPFGYISPQVMATCLVALPNLKQLHIEFQEVIPYLNQPHLPTHSILPSLISFHFSGTSNYLEDLLAQFDAPKLQTLSVTLWDEDLVVGFSQLVRFVSCAQKLILPIRAMVEFDFWRVLFKFIPLHGFDLTIVCHTLDEQVESMAVVCREVSPLLSRVERLDLHCSHLPPANRRIDPRHWLEIFQQFITVKNLYVSKQLRREITRVMRALSSEAAADILPELRTLFLEKLHRYGRASLSIINTLIASRLLFGHPVAIRQCTASDIDT